MDNAKKKEKVGDAGRTLKRKGVEVNNDDDDFEVSPPKKQISYVRIQSGPGESSGSACNRRRKHGLKANTIKKAKNVVFPRLRYRACPQVLVLAIEKLTEAQRKEVVEMGFGSILSLRIKNIPTMLSYWILDNFDPKSCEIRLQKNKTLHISAEDVYRVFGLPRGEKKIERKENNEQVDSYRRWINHFGENKYGVKARDVLGEMTREGGEGAFGELFRRNFMLLLNSCLIESNSMGYIKPQIMDCFEDVTSLDKWDWCSYVINRLVHHKVSWEKNKNNAFCGPILFLTLLYADRVEFYGNKVSCAYPTIKYWTCYDMKERQKSEFESGRFGDGFPTEPLDVPYEPIQPKSTYHTNITTAEASDNDLMKFAQNFMIKAKNVAHMMAELMSMIEEAPQNVVKSSSFLQMRDVTHKLVAPDPHAAASSKNPSQSQFWYLETEDEFWRQADRAATIAEIDKTIVQRNDFLKALDDIPRFNLGVTQEFGAHTDDLQDNGYEAADITIVTSVDTSEKSGKDIQEYEHVEQTSHEIIRQEMNPDTRTIDALNKWKEKVVDDGADDAQMTFGGYVQGAEKIKEHVGKTTHEMVRRDRKIIKKSLALLSPFQTRIVDSSEKINKDERVICFWVMNNTDEDEVLYNYGDMNLKRKDLMTLGPNKFINRGVLDVWSRIANQKEEYRAVSSPLRFFATTNVCLHTVVDAPIEMELDERMLDFKKKLSLELDTVLQMDLKKIDLFIFPILESDNSYLICVDVKNITVDIVDHTQLQGGEYDVKRYGKIPVILRSFLADFLKVKGLLAKAKKLKEAFIYVETVPWADEQNKVDCGVFTMRHMEAYLGDSNFRNDVGLKKNKKMLTRYMRIKYCAAILTSETNDLAAQEIEKAKAFYAQKCLVGAAAIDKLLLGK